MWNWGGTTTTGASKSSIRKGQRGWEGRPETPNGKKGISGSPNNIDKCDYIIEILKDDDSIALMSIYWFPLQCTYMMVVVVVWYTYYRYVHISIRMILLQSLIDDDKQTFYHPDFSVLLVSIKLMNIRNVWGYVWLGPTEADVLCGYARVYMSSLTFIYYDYEEGRKINR